MRRDAAVIFKRRELKLSRKRKRVRKRRKLSRKRKRVRKRGSSKRLKI